MPNKQLFIRKHFMIHINAFNDHDEYVENENKKPNVSTCKEERHIHYSKKSKIIILTFTAEIGNSTIKLNRVGTSTSLQNAVLEYSINDGETWNDYSIGSTITLSNSGDSVSLRGTNTTLGFDYSNYHQFVMTGKIKAEGDVTSLLNEVGGDCELQNFAFINLFKQCQSLTMAPELPATDLSGCSYCYQSMFERCTSLTTGPSILPATTLSDCCYYGMFSGCTSLKEGPYLSATDLKSESYRYMFAGCNSMTRIPDFTVNKLQGHHCLHAMFYNCSNLKDAKVTLNPIRLVPNCYHEMFRNCSSLENGPSVLPATALDDYCYRYMFSGCTSLEIAPDILVINLSGTLPLSYMFIGCSRLRHIKAMFTTTPSSTYTPSWTQGVSPTGVFIKNSSATWDVTGYNGIPTGWSVEYA